MKTDVVVSVRDREAFTTAVHAQLNRILASEIFRCSARHQILLRTIVTESLAGRSESLKEIVLARDVFGRPDYDPKRHTLVRVEANAVRRKLAEYYSHSASEDDVYIDIPVGRYVASFSYVSTKRVRRGWRKRYYAFAGCALAVCLLFALFGNRRSRPASSDVPVQITFDTGWTAQPAVSRDGSVLVYTSDRGPRGTADIWIQQPGKSPRDLTDDPAHDIMPDISPDGKRVIFRSWRKEEGIWSISAEGGLPTLLARGGYSPRFSPDGKWIAFSRAANDEVGHIFTIPAGGGVPQQLDYGTEEADCPVWSPDGSEAVFAARDISGKNYDLWTTKVRGARGKPSRRLGIETQLRVRALPAAFLCPQDWIGNRLLFVARQRDTSFLFEVSLAPSGGVGQVRPVPSAIGATGARVVREASGRLAILFTAERRRTNIWEYSLTAPAPLQQLTHDDSLRPGWTGTWPALSGDGNVLAFITERSGCPDICVKNLRMGITQWLAASPFLQSPLFLDRTGARMIFVQEKGPKMSVVLRNIAEKSDRVITTDCPALYDWSADGKFLLCGQDNNLFELRIGESAKIPLLYPAHAPVLARFSPDSRWIAFVSGTGQGETLGGFIAALDGSNRTIPVCQEVYVLSLHWAPDGNSLYYWSMRDGFRCLYKQRLDPQTKVPQDDPVAILHRHGVQAYPWSGGTLAVGSDRLAMTLMDELANIWEVDLPR